MEELTDDGIDAQGPREIPDDPLLHAFPVVENCVKNEVQWDQEGEKRADIAEPDPPVGNLVVPEQATSRMHVEVLVDA